METIKSILNRSPRPSNSQPQKLLTPAAPQGKQRTDNGADPDCPICGGLGYYSVSVPISDPLFGRALPCDCTAAYRAALLQRISGLIGDELKARLDDVIDAGPGTAAMLRSAREFVEQPAGMLTLWGGAGNSKTLILQAVVNECIGRGVVATYITMLDLLDYIREAYNGQAESAWSRLDRLSNVPMLAIDEVDKVKETEWTLERETSLIDKRYRLGLARRAGTLLAMNKSPLLLPDWISDRLYDGRNIVIKNTDPSMRKMMK